MEISEGVKIQTTLPATLDFARRHPARFEEQTRVLEGNNMEFRLKQRVDGLAGATALEREHVDGSTEPWIQDLLVALLHSLQRHKPTVLECGGFMGHTSAVLAQALQTQGGGKLYIVEFDPEAPQRADAVQTRLEALRIPDVEWIVYREEALAFIRRLPENDIDFAFLDDDHAKPHVRAELEALWLKMRQGGLITGHDAFGSCDLQTEFRALGGYALDLPRLGPAGGLGILQVL